MPGLFDPFELGVIPVYSQETNWTVAFIILVGFFIHGAYLHAKIYDIPSKVAAFFKDGMKEPLAKKTKLSPKLGVYMI